MTPGVVAFVHAKGTSDRVPGKNMRRLGDRPLVCHAIANALAARLVDAVVVDSDSDAILAEGIALGARPLMRPAELATNLATGDDLAYWQACEYPATDIVVQVVPTSPFLKPATIDRAVSMIGEQRVDSVVGVFEEALYTWIDGRPAYLRADGSIPNSVDLQKTVYETTGLYANRTEAVLRLRTRMNPAACAPLPVSRLEAIDINSEDDFRFAEVVWHGLHHADTPYSVPGTSR